MPYYYWIKRDYTYKYYLFVHKFNIHLLCKLLCKYYLCLKLVCDGKCNPNNHIYP